MDDYTDLVERLCAIEEELRDRAYEALTNAATSPDLGLSKAAEATERRLLAARRAIAKAIGSLHAANTSDLEAS